MTSSHQLSKVTKVLVALVVLLVTFFLVRSIYFPYTPEGQRRARIEAAREHAKTVVAPLLAKDKRFADVTAVGWWKDEGYFWVRGGVDTEADLRDLKRLIIETHPPAPIVWDVDVAERHVESTNVTTKIP